MNAADLTDQFTAAITRYAKEGLSAVRLQDGPPVLSHVCFKFADAAAYTETVDAARTLGVITQTTFKDKQVTWCKLTAPLRQDGLTLHWLELVELKGKAAQSSGFSSLGYFISGMNEPVKSSSSDGKIVFRYQGKHASMMARS